MSLITHIDGVPLFTTIAEAVLWGSQYGLTGHHTHTVLGQTGYMGGTDHATITSAMQGGVVSNITTQQISNTSTGSVGGGGGGY
jgi:hypothetical protein